MENKELLLATSDMMDQKLDSIHVRMDTFDTKLNALDMKIDAVDEKLSAEIRAVDEKLSAEIRKTNITLENYVVPRIKHIEQCYLSTSERYINETGRIDGLVVDMQVVKSIVQDHSVQLQKIS